MSLYPSEYDLPDEDWMYLPRCEFCGAWMKIQPIRTEGWEDWVEKNNLDTHTFPYEPLTRVRDGGVKEYLLAAGYTEIRICTRCGKENRNDIA